MTFGPTAPIRHLPATQCDGELYGDRAGAGHLAGFGGHAPLAPGLRYGVILATSLLLCGGAIQGGAPAGAGPAAAPTPAAP